MFDDDSEKKYNNARFRNQKLLLGRSPSLHEVPKPEVESMELKYYYKKMNMKISNSRSEYRRTLLEEKYHCGHLDFGALPFD